MVISIEDSKKMADKNYEFFVANLKDLYKSYKNKFVVIKDEKVIGAYDSFDDAFKTTIKTEELGTFLIQQCLKEGTEVNYFHSNNIAFV